MAEEWRLLQYAKSGYEGLDKILTTEQQHTINRETLIVKKFSAFVVNHENLTNEIKTATNNYQF